jgi:hypothetical protein
MIMSMAVLFPITPVKPLPLLTGIWLFALAASLPLQAQETKPAAPPPKGDVVMESMSAPVIRGKKITGYEHATVIMWLTTKDHAGLVCANRYALADSFLIDLHDHPIPTRNKKEAREEAEERLYQIATDVFGPRVIRRLRVEWARNSTSGKTTIFGTFTDVQCEAAK